MALPQWPLKLQERAVPTLPISLQGRRDSVAPATSIT